MCRRATTVLSRVQYINTQRAVRVRTRAVRVRTINTNRVRNGIAKSYTRLACDCACECDSYGGRGRDERDETRRERDTSWNGMGVDSTHAMHCNAIAEHSTAQNGTAQCSATSERQQATIKSRALRRRRTIQRAEWVNAHSSDGANGKWRRLRLATREQMPAGQQLRSASATTSAIPEQSRAELPTEYACRGVHQPHISLYYNYTRVLYHSGSVRQ